MVEKLTLEQVRESFEGCSLADLHSYVKQLKEAIEKTNDFIIECQKDIKKMSEEYYQNFDNRKIPIDDIKSIARSFNELERLKGELKTLLYTGEFLFDIDSIEAATKQIFRLKAEIKHLQDGYRVGSCQDLLEYNSMAALVNKGYKSGSYQLLDSSKSMLALIIEKEYVDREGQRRIKYMNEILEQIEIVIKERTESDRSS